MKKTAMSGKKEEMPDTPAETTRRGLLGKIWMGLVSLALLEGAWIVIDFFKPRKFRAVDDPVETIIVAGPVESFSPGTVTAFPQGKFYLSRLENGGFLALHRQCTHLGCTLPWISEEERFVCPCHASVFDIKGGVCSPPAPRPMDLFTIRIENGIVKVETSKLLKRTECADSQVAFS